MERLDRLDAQMEERLKKVVEDLGASLRQEMAAQAAVLRQEMREGRVALKAEVRADMQAELAAFKTTFEREFANVRSCIANSMASADDDELSPILTADGAAPPNFPATRKALWEMTTTELNDLLQALNFRAPRGLHARRRALAKITGARL